MRGLLLLLLPALVLAQDFEFQQEFDTIPVEIEEWQPFCPWAGGYTDLHPDFCDIDSDGDLDLFIGDFFHYVDYYQNIGTPFVPNFTLYAYNWDSVCCFPNNNLTNPDFWDLDNDGDKDLLIGAGYVRYYRNEGTPTDPDFTGYSDTLFDISGNWVFGTHIAMIDIDADNDGDLICGEYQGHLQLYRNVGTPDSFAFFLEDSYWLEANVGADADPVFCDIDFDNDFDLFIGDFDGHIWYYLNEGSPDTFNFTYQTDHFANIDVGDHASPEFADIDGDGDYDSFVGSEGNGLFFYENTGTPINPILALISGNYLTLELQFMAKAQFVDINGDGAIDMLIGEDDQISYFENIGTSENPNYQFIEDNWQGISRLAIKPFFIDINADGNLDLFAGEGVIPGPPTVALYINHGTPQNPQMVLYDPAYITNEDFHVNTNPGLTDIDADGDYDLFISSGQGRFFYYQNEGDSLTPNFTLMDSLWQGIQFPYPYHDWKGFTFGDLDDDEDFDLLMRNSLQDNLHFYRNTGTPQTPNMYLETEDFFDHSVEFIYTPSLADIDSDADLDLFIGDGSGGIFFFRNVTGQNEVGPRRPIGPPLPQLDFTIGPNPANPVTWISFSLPAPQEATVAVYNILGAKITTLASGLQMPGTHNVIWNASQYSSGVYIIRLETPQSTSSQRVIVVK